ncbi:protein of unknown function [Paraburkholderia dioscoreae]|uniref:Uncharacterized protein n=1 Tax=Paraburkholderia dioscoreae TaxID=2604047 RepID=A0A5Q4ZM51_9BURK|nr:protein of unknown function [Paraburkholderia dioscoreae]
MPPFTLRLKVTKVERRSGKQAREDPIRLTTRAMTWLRHSPSRGPHRATSWESFDESVSLRSSRQPRPSHAS